MGSACGLANVGCRSAEQADGGTQSPYQSTCACTLGASVGDKSALRPFRERGGRAVTSAVERGRSGFGAGHRIVGGGGRANMAILHRAIRSGVNPPGANGAGANFTTARRISAGHRKAHSGNESRKARRVETLYIRRCRPETAVPKCIH